MRVVLVLCVAIVATVAGELAPFKPALVDGVPGRYIITLKVIGLKR